ncbi:MAG: stage sporulation protein, partial [Chloroflexota bacterium]|nr:stage sporulation protein [Chloroflexota bacterium]
MTLGALLVALSIVLAAAQPQSVAGQAARAVGDAGSRAVAYARGLPRTDGAAEALKNETLNPKLTRPAAAYVGYPSGSVAPGETAVVPVRIRNQSDDTWAPQGPTPIALAYHVYDAAGGLVMWDGLRSALASDIVPGGDAIVPLRITAPAATGIYTITPDLIREGQAWFSAADAPPGSFSLRVTTNVDAAYGRTTAPASIVPGGDATIEVHVRNAGLAAWPAGGEHPVRLGYHWLDGTPIPVVWDGGRATLPHDVQPGEELALVLSVRAPRAEATLLLAWDMVQEGVGWFSGQAVTPKHEVVRVQSGVTLYGKGWGHGIGLSQWGAQGWAEGATGVKLTGEQIVARYFPGADLATQPATSPFRVLLSAPSTGCVGRTIENVAHLRSEGGMRLVNDADPSVVYLATAPGQSVRISASGSSLVAVDEWSGRVVFAGGTAALRVVPIQWWDPIGIAEKGLWYRGSLTVALRGPSQLRVVNDVSSDDYMMGALPGEMPSQWQMEALRAQAITARTYASWRQATAGDRAWDVRDDTA